MALDNNNAMPRSDELDGIEDAIVDFFTNRIESGNLPLEEVTRLMARYGLMDPAAFVAEMKERMASEAADSCGQEGAE